MSFNVDGFLRLSDVDVERRRVFVRADLDCPFDEAGALAADDKLRAVLPTLKALLEREAQVVVGAHLAPRSDGLEASPRSLEPCAAKLAELLDAEVYLPDRCTGLLTQKLIAELRPGRLVLLENLLADPREAAADASLARDLAQGVEVFVGDCLAGPHQLCSMIELPRLVRERALGLTLERELVVANRLRHEWGPGLVMVVGGRFAHYRAVLAFAAASPGVTVLAVGELARSLSERPTDTSEATAAEDAAALADAPSASEKAEARAWLQKAKTRGVIVELGNDSEVVDRMVPAFERARATLLVGVLPVDAASKAAISAASRGSSIVASVDGPSEDILTLLDHPGPPKTRFVSSGGQSFLALLCGQKLAGVEALRRVG
jgi:3-phosphoglycerate kinase